MKLAISPHATILGMCKLRRRHLPIGSCFSSDDKLIYFLPFQPLIKNPKNSFPTLGFTLHI